MLADVRLFQLISPTLPVGGFTYSQGLEWAVEEGWVHVSEGALPEFIGWVMALYGLEGA